MNRPIKIPALFVVVISIAVPVVYLRHTNRSTYHTGLGLRPFTSETSKTQDPTIQVSTSLNLHGAILCLLAA